MPDQSGRSLSSTEEAALSGDSQIRWPTCDWCDGCRRCGLHQPDCAERGTEAECEDESHA